MSKKITLEYILLAIILILSFSLRLYKIDNPLADWHSWRQADTSSVSRNFLKYGYNPLSPRFDDLSSLPSGLENPQGWRMVEFPAYNLLHAKVSQIFPQKPLEWWGRMISILFSLGSLFLLFLLVKKYTQTKTALLAAFFFGVLPFNIYYSRVVLPEPMMVFTSLLSIYLFSHWLEKGKFSLLAYSFSIFFTALTFLLKPFAIFLFFPLIYLLWQKQRCQFLKRPTIYLYLFLSVLPFILWRAWISQYPEGIPNYAWLFNEANIRFKGAFFYWIFAERVGRLMLGYWGLPLLVLGILAKRESREGWFFHFWLLGVLLYFMVVAGGNVHHDYYQILAVPAICIFLAKGTSFLLSAQPFQKLLSWTLLSVSLLFMLAFSWYEIRGFFNVNHPEIVQAGLATDALVPRAAKVIAPYDGDTAFLYQTNRQGWPLATSEISVDYLISRGATHYISVKFDANTQELMQRYAILKQTENFVILDLSSPK